MCPYYEIIIPIVNSMKNKPKPLVCIFAHPDDESFGPGGAVAKFASERDVYLICVTSGDAGQNSSQKKELAECRKDELKSSAQILGVKDVYFLNFKDGCLCNSNYHKIASKITEKLNQVKPDTILTFNLAGVSGHLDHIAVSFISTYIFNKLDYLKTLLYWCEKKEIIKNIKDYFVFMPTGYKREEVDLIIDTSFFWDTKVKAMKAHQSQLHDINYILPLQEKTPKEEYFLVRNK